MTLSDEDRNLLIEHRIERSREGEKEARLLLKHNMYSAAINRVYYGMYYALAALALKYGFKTTKHSQLIGWFNRTFIKGNLIEIKYAKILIKAFEKRMDGDYEDFINFSPDEIKKMIGEMNDFTARIKIIIDEK